MDLTSLSGQQLLTIGAALCLLASALILAAVWIYAFHFPESARRFLNRAACINLDAVPNDLMLKPKITIFDYWRFKKFLESRSLLDNEEMDALKNAELKKWKQTAAHFSGFSAIFHMGTTEGVLIIALFVMAVKEAIHRLAQLL